MVKCTRSVTLLGFCIVANCLFARDLLDYRGRENLDKDTSTYEFAFTLSENGSSMVMDLKSELEWGELDVWFGGAGFQVIGNYTGEQAFAYEKAVFGPFNSQEPITVRISARHASGRWRIRFSEISRQSLQSTLLVSGLLVVLITIFIVLWWKKSLQTSWKWLLIGAGVWFVGVLFKFVLAYLANAPVFAFIKSSLGHTGYLILGSTYIGLLTGIFEIGMTLVFALLIRGIYDNPRRALSVGLGAGVVEALLIGLSSLGSYVTALTGAVNSAAMMSALSQAMVVTPFLWLIGSVERIIAILCHTSSRALVLFAVAQHKARYFWAGFFILTAIDAVAGYVHLAGLINKVSTWWIELLLLPFAVGSVFIIKWCYENWIMVRKSGTQGITVSEN
ncbi:hypothetical protein AMJ83_01440 [candidate division WOR_3 bacterium SM23_42]|uniref:YhfC family intramembrane metalloprotease n=1 Tax=candidate division WOR_3 bacterium SM23_42 TaxID=1703779 RepID=A0A0S8FYT2_UNCW3|nr:MAG: hypothetical protein AMJ83_01440 [candidate division WOR_3 bacterium SM23_42]